jgi:Bax protein
MFIFGIVASKQRRINHASKLSVIVLALVAIASAFLIAPAYLYWFSDLVAPRKNVLLIEERKVASPSDLERFNEKLVKPVVYLNAPKLADLNSSERKDRFIEIILPSILIVKHRRAQERALAIVISQKFYPNRAERRFMSGLLEAYRAKDLDDLLLKLQTHPNSVAIAQAALESAWGVSNVFAETNNLFGVWSFKTDEPRYLAVTRRNGRKVFVRRYKSIYDSIEDYFLVLAIGVAFEDFRETRSSPADPVVLVGYLERYSEQRDEYVKKLRRLIETNNLTRFDDYALDPQYIVEKAAL